MNVYWKKLKMKENFPICLRCQFKRNRNQTVQVIHIHQKSLSRTQQHPLWKRSSLRRKLSKKRNCQIFKMISRQHLWTWRRQGQLKVQGRQHFLRDYFQWYKGALLLKKVRIWDQNLRYLTYWSTVIHLICSKLTNRLWNCSSSTVSVHLELSKSKMINSAVGKTKYFLVHPTKSILLDFKMANG